MKLSDYIVDFLVKQGVKHAFVGTGGNIVHVIDSIGKRNDIDYAYVSAWEYKGEPADAILHKEELEFKDIELKQRSYK